MNEWNKKQDLGLNWCFWFSPLQMLASGSTTKTGEDDPGFDSENFLSRTHESSDDNSMDSSPVGKQRKQMIRKCFACEAEVGDNEGLGNHIKLQHQDSEGLYVCPASGCSWSGPRKELFRKHMWNHTECVCPKCGKLFKRRTFSEHVSACSQEKSSKCPSCDLYFTEKLLKRHIARVHIAQRSFLCGDCGKAFKTLTALKQHTVTHTLEHPFKCADCGRSFNKDWNYTQHRRIHTGELPYECEVCGEKFRHNVTMKQHRQKHSPSQSESSEWFGST